MDDTEVKDTILNGRPVTVMPAWKGILSPKEIDALIQLVEHTSS